MTVECTSSTDMSNTKSLDDVQRELDAVKAERRRRQRALYETRRPRPLITSKNHVRLPAAVHTVVWKNVLSRREECEGPRPPYRPDMSLPPQLLTMAYVTRPDGLLTPCPRHIMGNKVEALDLSPWDLSSTMQAEQMWRENRCIKTLRLSGREFVEDQDKVFRALSHVGPQLTSLELSNCSGVVSGALAILLSGLGHRLTSLDLSKCLGMGDGHLVEVATGCPSVTSLDLSSWKELTDQGLAAAASDGRLSALQRLVVSYCPGVGDDGLRAVLGRCLALRELLAGDCTKVTGRAFLGKIYPGGVATAPVRGLKRLELPGCRQLHESAMEWIVAGCTDLRSLIVSGCGSIKPGGVEFLAASHPDLLRLGLAGCAGLGGSTALTFIAERSGRCLRHLDISDIPSTAATVVGKILRHCGQLEFIDLSGLTNVDCSSFSGLGGGGRSHVVEGRDEDDDEDAPDATSFASVHPQVQANRTSQKACKGLPGGVALEFEGNEARVCGTPSLPHLRVARMLRLPSLDDSSMVCFAKACPVLEELRVSDSPMVTSACLVPLASFCPLLRSLGLDRCQAASDEKALAATCRRLPGLENLAIGIAAKDEGKISKKWVGYSDGSSRGSGGQRTSSRSPSRRAPYGGSLEGSSCSPAPAIGTRPLGPDSSITSFTGGALFAAASTNCARLTTLGLEGHKRLIFSSKHCPPGTFPCLTEVRLVGCAAVDDDGLLVLLKACPRVRSLSLAGSGVSQAGLAHSISSQKLSFVEMLPPAVVSAPSSRRTRTTASLESPTPTEQYQTLAMDLQRKGNAVSVSPPSPPMEQESHLVGSRLPGALTREEVDEAASDGFLTRHVDNRSNVSQGGSSRSIGSRAATGRIEMARGMKPSMNHELHLATAAVVSRFDKEQLALKTLSRALRHLMDQRRAKLMTCARTICRVILSYRFKTSYDQPDKVRLNCAKKAAKVIQEKVREHHARKRDAVARKLQALWMRYAARCIFVHQLRLRRSAVGFQRLWRGYFVRSRYQIREKVKELKHEKKMLGKHWFKQAAASRHIAQDPEALVAEKIRREEMRLEVHQCLSFVRNEKQRLGACKASKLQAILEGEEAIRFGTMPPAPRRQIVRGAFDVHPCVRHLRNGRPVPFDGEARLPPPEKSQRSSSGKGGATNTIAFDGEVKVKDPDDFNVFRKGPGELWGGHENGPVKDKAMADKEWEEQRAAEAMREKERTLCAHCQKFFCSVSCKDCRRGYCLRCSRQIHSEPARLGHDVGPFHRPERATPKASHWGFDGGGGNTRDARKAKKSARTLPACARRAKAFVHTIKVLRHKETMNVDKQRVKVKMKDRRELEEAQERERKINEEYNRASTEEKNAASTIQRTCQSYMNKLRRRREFGIRQRAQVEGQKLKMKDIVTRIQALYRGYSVRLSLREQGNETTVLGESPGSGSGSRAEAMLPHGVPRLLPGISRDKATAAARVQRDCILRRRWEREAAIANLKNVIEESNRMFASDFPWALEKHKALEAKSTLVTRRRGSARSAWNRLQEELSNLDPSLPPDDPEKVRLTKEIDLQNIRIHHLNNLFEVTEKGLYWTKSFIRQNYRRHAANMASKAGAGHTFAWLEEELYSLNEVVDFASKRLEGAADVLELEFFRGWLMDQIERAGRQRLMIDVEQESLLETEAAHYVKSLSHASKCRENLEELLKAYGIDTQLGAERVGAELANARAEEGTDDKFLWVARVTSLKNKEETMREKVQVSLQRGLEEEMTMEDRYMDESVRIANDVADAPISHFSKMKASLVDPPHHPAHLSFESWRKVYRAQPWLAAQTQAEHKRKAARTSKIEDLEEMRAVTATARSHQVLAAKEVATLKAELEVIEQRLAFKGSGAIGDNVVQVPLTDEERTRMEIDLVKGREKLTGLEERLERRKKANSHKEEELKAKEADLQAEITAEEERHARQAAAMAAFRAAERDETAAQFGKEHADAAMERIKSRIENLKATQEELGEKEPGKQKDKKKKGLLNTIIGFALGTDGTDHNEDEATGMDYAEQTQLIAQRAKMALVNRQIEDLKKAKKTISTDFESADAQLVLAEDIFADNDGGHESSKDAQRMQARVREAKQRAIDAKEQQENQRQQTKEEEAAKRAKEAKEKAEMDIAKRVAEEMGMGHVGKGRGVILAAKRIQRKMAGEKTIYGGVFDDENAAVEAAIKSRHKAKLGKAEAVVEFTFTVGTEETDSFTSKQARLESQGLPHFRKLSKGLGGKDAVFLWVRKTLDSSEFITEIRITRGDPESASSQSLKPLGFTSYGHPKLAARGSGQPSILIWGKKDPHSDGIADVDLSYNQADEKKLADVGFKMVPSKLVDCGLPDVRLWYSTVKRGATTLPSVKAILHEMGEVREMLQKNPGDVKLMEVESKLESKLAQATEAEEMKAMDRSNPLKSAIEAYALTGADVDHLITHFAAMDVERRGTIDVGTFFEHLEWPRNAFANHLFNFMESTDEDNRVDFGDFVKLICSYCMFGKADLLRYAYTVYDQGKGFVSYEDLLSLLNDIHKSNAGPIERALRDAGISSTGQLSFNDFLDLDRRFPKMFYPVARLQLEMRKKFLGEEFWLRKMHMFNEARENIIKEADGSATKARKAKHREEELLFLKTKTQEAFDTAKQRSQMVANRARQKVEESMWMSKLLS